MDEVSADAVESGDTVGHRRLIITDAILTACRGIDTSTATDADRDLLREILTTGPAGPHELEDAARKSGVGPSAALVGVALYNCIDRWNNDGKTLLVQWDLPDIDGSDDDKALLQAVHAVLKSTALYDDGGSSDGVCETTLELASVFESRGCHDDALAASFTASNFAQRAPLRLRAFDAALHASILAQNAEATGLAMAGRSLALAESSSPQGQLLAFDSIAAALRHLPKTDSNRARALSLIGNATVSGSLALRAWQPILAALESGGLAADGPSNAAIAALTEWETALWSNRQFQELVVALELVREQLLDHQDENAVVTSWTTGSFEHYAYRNAIPHSRSMLRERDIDQIVLLLGHELSHVLALQGGIGMADIALRAASADLELRLWQQVASGTTTAADLPPVAAPVDLAAVEQALDVARKRQILQATWSPWLEGIACFAELAVNPSANDIASDIGEVLLNCTDEQFLDANPDASVEEWFRRRSAASEEMYTQAQNSDGRARLRGYLDSHRQKYLAGYLTVRSVVSCWRRRVGDKLTGADAYRLLLHRTRFDTRRAIPDLSLPAAQFAEQAEKAMLDWVAEVASTHTDDIIAVANSADRGVWEDNRLIQEIGTVDPGKVDNDAWEILRESIFEALQTGTRNSEDVASIDHAKQYDGAKQGSASDPRLQISELVASQIVAQRRVLVLGRASCPFWLDSSAGRLICVVRVTEHRRDDGRSSYDGMVAAIPRSSLDELQAEIKRIGESRMTIYRVVDLVPNWLGDDRAFGRQAVVLTYGDWMLVQNRGLFTGLSSVPLSWIQDIKDRISPPALLTAEYELSAFASAARRVHSWSKSVTEGMAEDTAQSPENQRLADQIDDLAAEVIDAADGDQVIERRVCRLLLEASFGAGDLCEGLLSQGIRYLDDGMPVRRSLVVDAAFFSAFEPAVVQWLDTEPGSAGQLFEKIDEKWDIAPFGAARG